jgi:hypothetical protein
MNGRGAAPSQNHAQADSSSAQKSPVQQNGSSAHQNGRVAIAASRGGRGFNPNFRGRGNFVNNGNFERGRGGPSRGRGRGRGAFASPVQSS